MLPATYPCGAFVVSLTCTIVFHSSLHINGARCLKQFYLNDERNRTELTAANIPNWQLSILPSFPLYHLHRNIFLCFSLFFQIHFRLLLISHNLRSLIFCNHYQLSIACSFLPLVWKVVIAAEYTRYNISANCQQLLRYNTKNPQHKGCGRENT